MKRSALSAGVSMVLLCSGCDSIFTDLGIESMPPDGALPDPDAGPGDAATGPVVLTTGTFEGRTGYLASGDVSIVQQGGALELVFGDNFDSQAVPGPVVIVSTRDPLGNTIDPDAGDIEVGVLQSERGPQRYALPAGAESAGFVWVYCRPFRVEVARAALSPTGQP